MSCIYNYLAIQLIFIGKYLGNLSLTLDAKSVFMF